MRLFDTLLDIGRLISFHVKIARKLGSNNACIFLEQLIYWTGKEMGKDSPRDGWIYKSTEKIYEETNLTYKEQILARDILKKDGILEEHYKRLEHKLYYKINIEGLNSWWERKPDKTPDSSEMTKGNLGRFQEDEAKVNKTLTTPSKPALNNGFSRNDLSSDGEMTFGKMVYTESTNTRILTRENARARNNFFLSEEWVPSDEILAIVKSKCEPSDEALKVAIDEFKKFYIKKKVEKTNWDRAFQSWCENRRSWRGGGYKVEASIPEVNHFVKTEHDSSLKPLEDKVKKTLKASVNESSMFGFIEPIKFYKLEKNLLVVTVPSRYIREWVNANYLEVLKKVSSKFNNAIENIEVKIRQADMIA